MARVCPACRQQVGDANGYVCNHCGTELPARLQQAWSPQASDRPHTANEPSPAFRKSPPVVSTTPAAGNGGGRRASIATVGFFAVVVLTLVGLARPTATNPRPANQALILASPTAPGPIASDTQPPTQQNSPFTEPAETVDGSEDANDAPVESVDPVEQATPESTPDDPSSQALADMEIAFAGSPSQADIKGALDPALALYGLKPSEENYSRAGSTLVALRMEAEKGGCDACTEMAILDAMLRDGALPGMTFPEHAAWAVSVLESE